MEREKLEDVRRDPAAGCLLRIFWMIIGNVILLFSAYGITQQQDSLLSIADIFYWVFVAALLGARYADIRYFGGMTAEGAPATIADWRRYALVVLIICTGLWLAAHAAVIIFAPEA